MNLPLILHFVFNQVVQPYFLSCLDPPSGCGWLMLSEGFNRCETHAREITDILLVDSSLISDS